MKYHLITGRTYPVRARLRELGGTWDPIARGWQIPEENIGAACALVGNAPPLRKAGAKYRHDRSGGNVSVVYRFSSGHVAYRNKAGRCEDAPCCGCCTI